MGELAIGCFPAGGDISFVLLWYTYDPRGEGMITAAAICIDGTIFTLPKPARHAQLMVMAESQAGRWPDHDEQGFVNEHGEFMTRAQAFNEAMRCEQFTNEALAPGMLFSEDLW